MTRWILLVIVLATGCRQRERLVIGSKNFTESDLLGEIVAQQLERRTHIPIERRFHLGGSFVCHTALTSGQIDAYVEYSGTAYTAILKNQPGPNPDSIYRATSAEYRSRFGLLWLAPLGFNNSFAI